VTCTWAACVHEGRVRRVGLDGVTWAILCRRHSNVVDRAINNIMRDESTIPTLIKVWQLAQRGMMNARRNDG
jgi:hypothetical protein